VSEQQQTNSNLTNTTTDSIQPKRVLIVEDDDVNRWLASRLLEQKGYAISTATNGEVALAILKLEPFDLILMDIQMPVMDGLSTTRAIRQQERQTGMHIPIIAFTPETGTLKTQRYWQAGMDGHLAKPIHTGEFYRIIEAVMRLHARLIDASALPSTFDAKEALCRLNNNVELLQQLAERFFNTAPHLLLAMRRAIAKDDPYNLDFAAHRLRGAASNLSAHAVVELAERLELIGSVRNMAQAEITLTILEQELDRLHAAFTLAMQTFQAQFNS
jgi:two-component system, sensor histidine kinase and response regulator